MSKRRLQYSSETKEAIGDALVDSAFVSLVQTAKKHGLETEVLLAKLVNRVETQRNKRLKTEPIVDTMWWNMFPSELVATVFSFLPLKSCASFSECCHETNKVVSLYAINLLLKSKLGTCLVERHFEKQSPERGVYSPIFLLFCVNACPQTGSYLYFSNKTTGMEFKRLVCNTYSNDIDREHSYMDWGRVMFVIDGIVVIQCIQGYEGRFAVSRCPLPALIRTISPNSIQVWSHGGRVHWQEDMERMWANGWRMYVDETSDATFDDDDDDDDDSSNSFTL